MKVVVISVSGETGTGKTTSVLIALNRQHFVTFYTLAEGDLEMQSLEDRPKTMDTQGARCRSCRLPYRNAEEALLNMFSAEICDEHSIIAAFLVKTIYVLAKQAMTEASDFQFVLERSGTGINDLIWTETAEKLFVACCKWKAKDKGRLTAASIASVLAEYRRSVRPE